MLEQTDVHVITPENVKHYVRAANEGNVQAKRVLDAIDIWCTQLLRNKDSVCGCKGCSRSAKAFAFDGDLPSTFVIQISPAGDTGIIAGVCDQCSKRTDMLAAAREVMEETASLETSRGHTVH